MKTQKKAENTAKTNVHANAMGQQKPITITKEMRKAAKKNINDELSIVERQVKLSKAYRDIAVYDAERIQALILRARLEAGPSTPNAKNNEESAKEPQSSSDMKVVKED